VHGGLLGASVVLEWLGHAGGTWHATADRGSDKYGAIFDRYASAVGSRLSGFAASSSSVPHPSARAAPW
jgi:hypothetical protein